MRCSLSISHMATPNPVNSSNENKTWEDDKRASLLPKNIMISGLCGITLSIAVIMDVIIVAIHGRLCPSLVPISLLLSAWTLTALTLWLSSPSLNCPLYHNHHYHLHCPLYHDHHDHHHWHSKWSRLVVIGLEVGEIIALWLVGARKLRIIWLDHNDDDWWWWWQWCRW